MILRRALSLAAALACAAVALAGCQSGGGVYVEGDGGVHQPLH